MFTSELNPGSGMVPIGAAVAGVLVARFSRVTDPMKVSYEIGIMDTSKTYVFPKTLLSSMPAKDSVRVK